MMNGPFIRWVTITIVAGLAFLGVIIQQRNQVLKEKNLQLILQNDSILSVNLQLEKNIRKLQCEVDSLKPCAATKNSLAYH